MYGMYGKMGSGCGPRNTVHVGHTVHQQGRDKQVLMAIGAAFPAL